MNVVISWEDESNLKVSKVGYITVFTFVVLSTISFTITAGLATKSLVIGLSSTIIGYSVLFCKTTIFFTC